MKSINADALRINALCAADSKLSGVLKRVKARISTLGLDITGQGGFSPLGPDEPREAAWDEAGVRDWVDSVEQPKESDSEFAKAERGRQLDLLCALAVTLTQRFG